MGIADKGNKLGNGVVYKIAFMAATKNPDFQLILQEDEQSALFKSKSTGQYHLMVSPVYDSGVLGEGFLMKNRLPQLQNFLAKASMQEGTDLQLDNQTLHTHYFICQTQGTRHYVYGYVSPQGALTIKDSFPFFNPNLKSRAHRLDIVKEIPHSSYRYLNTGKQYNLTDCGHHMLHEFKEKIGLEPAPNFLQRHAKKIGFASGVIVMALLLTIGLVCSGGVLSLPMIGIAAGLTLANGFWGAYWANKQENASFNLERQENLTLFSAYHLKFTPGSNVVSAMKKLPAVVGPGANAPVDKKDKKPPDGKNLETIACSEESSDECLKDSSDCFDFI